MKKFIIIATAVAVFVAAMVLKEIQRGESVAIDTNTEQQITASSETNGAIPRLVDLGSDKCVPCKKMAPILERISEEYQGTLIVEFINVRTNPDAGKEWNIRVIPTQIFIDASGKELFRHEGFMAKDAILGKWNELGIMLPDKPSTTGS